MTERILVTGGAGFIGSHLVDALVDKGHQVDVIDNLEPQVHKAKPGYLNRKAAYAFADVRDEKALAKLLKDAEAVVHLAAMVGVGQSMYQVTRYVEANVMGTAKLLQALVDDRHDVKKLLVASSMSIYGEGAYACPYRRFTSSLAWSRSYVARRKARRAPSIPAPSPALAGRDAWSGAHPEGLYVQESVHMFGKLDI